MRTPATVTVRVTVTRGAERRHGRRAATTGAKSARRGRWRRSGKGEKVKGDGQHCTPGGEPLLGWKHGVRVKGAQGVKEVERQLREPCDEPGRKTSDRDEKSFKITI